jgi:hypothetical protein
VLLDARLRGHDKPWLDSGLPAFAEAKPCFRLWVAWAALASRRQAPE